MVLKGEFIMMKYTKACIEKYVSDGHINNIALRIGMRDDIIADIFKSTEQSIDSKTLFDMASVTKIMSTTVLCLIALEKGYIKLSDRASTFFEAANDKKITVEHLLTHTMGIGHKSMIAEGNNYDNIADYILNIPSDVPVGSDVLYSCPGYILLGKILEKVFGKRLDELFREVIAKPLGMEYSSFCPDKKNQVVNSNISLNEKGMVNDYNCRFLGGVAGNAGLFSNLDDVDKYVKMLLDYGSPVIKKETFLSAIKNYTYNMSESRGLGFVYVDEKYKQTGKLFQNGSIGHCGHTGQSVFFDINTGLYVIVLSDATISTTKKYGREKYDIVMRMREDIHNAISDDLINLKL